MTSEIEVTEERLRSFLTQLLAECGILDRLVYKNKNQHRRSSYFQYLLKVKRDLKLLQSAHLEDLLESCFNVVSDRKAKQKVHLLESLKWNHDAGKYNFMERLLGSARLLSEMTEPILKAATEISKLLARSFFMGLSLTILALLGRIRLLVQQMLKDIVFLFNEVSCIAQKKQDIKINQDGIEVFREYYPNMEEVITLECVWDKDKYVLVEKAQKISPKFPEELLEETEPPKQPVTLYRSVEAFLGDIELDSNDSNLDHMKPDDAFLRPEEALETIDEPPSKKPCSGDGLIGSSGSSKTRVAFISVKKPLTICTAALQMNKAESESSNKDDEEDPSFSLLAGETTRGSLF
ncbi:hypothetical protein V2J09_007773 [Rumex salicifolius]